MSLLDMIQVIIYLILLVGLTPLLGNFIYKVCQPQKHFLLPVFGWLEKLTYRVAGIDPKQEENWKQYAVNLLIFNLVGIILLFLIQVFQSRLPFNPVKLPDVSWHLAFNTAVSFVTNTNWQSYAGEITLSYLVQLAGLTVQNFVSAATGMAVMLAIIRGLVRKTTDKIGNFWVDLVRSTLYVLLPLSIIMSVVLISQGVIQNFNEPMVAVTVAGNEQLIPMGPVASQIAIKQLGTNGGGFFNANSAHPFENPTPLTNFLEMLAILLIPMALTYTYGKMTGSVRHGWTIFTVMMILLLSGIIISLWSEFHPNDLYSSSTLMEGKEVRFGIVNSNLWSVVTTAASNGSVNAMHDSLTPIAGMVAIVNIMLGEVIFGGVGAGMYGMVVFILLTVFIAGLMVGRTPEYLGKKIEAFEIQMSLLAILAPSLVILAFSALALSTEQGLAGLTNAGPHGLTEILYAYSSAAGNNGSAFAGLNANTAFYNLTLGFAMLIGRFGVIIPILAIAGSLASKKTTPVTSGTFRTDNWLFIGLLTAIILIVGGLTFFPALSLGPVIDHLLLQTGVTF